MSAVPRSLSSNALLDRLPPAQRRRLLTQCEPMVLALGAVLSTPGQRMRRVIFPLSGLVAESMGGAGHDTVQLRLVGREGALGAVVLLDKAVAVMHALVCQSGQALTISGRRFHAALREESHLRPMMERYLQVQLGQLARTGVCLRFHAAEPRLARWLLAASDSALSTSFSITHERLARLLGVRRSSVTVCAGELQAQGLIRYVRGDIRILDRRGLEAIACECYLADRETYRRHFPVRPVFSPERFG